MGDVNRRHVASEYQVEITTRAHQCGFQTRKRTQARPKIGNPAVMKVAEPVCPSNQGDIACSLPDTLCDVIDNVSKLPWKEGFVPSHPRAFPAHKYVPGGLHAQIVTLAVRFPGIMRSNNIWVSCRVSNGLAAPYSGGRFPEGS